MTAKNTGLEPALHEYILRSTLREPDVLRDLRDETHATMQDAAMQIAPEQGQLMALLAHAIRAKRYLEIGVFTGYSSLAMALALPADGKIVACDVSEEYTGMARRYWERAGVSDKIDLRIAPALDTLAALKAAKAEPFDMAFIDADKPNVDAYYEGALGLLRPGGLLLVDNVLWSGRVLDADPAESTRALIAIVAKARADDRVDVSLLPVSDGILVACKR
jgi:predicted O-methyltransferase YrrM